MLTSLALGSVVDDVPVLQMPSTKKTTVFSTRKRERGKEEEEENEAKDLS